MMVMIWMNMSDRYKIFKKRKILFEYESEHFYYISIEKQNLVEHDNPVYKDAEHMKHITNLKQKNKKSI